jgi:hypothetical protein
MEMSTPDRLTLNELSPSKKKRLSGDKAALGLTAHEIRSSPVTLSFSGEGSLLNGPKARDHPAEKKKQRTSHSAIMNDSQWQEVVILLYCVIYVVYFLSDAVLYLVPLLIYFVFSIENGRQLQWWFILTNLEE